MLKAEELKKLKLKQKLIRQMKKKKMIKKRKGILFHLMGQIVII